MAQGRCEVEICFGGAGASVHVPRGTTLLAAARLVGVPLARGCGGDGLCGRCGVWVVGEGGRLSAEQVDEVRVKQRNRIEPGLRLACRARAMADVTVATPYG